MKTLILLPLLISCTDGGKTPIDTSEPEDTEVIPLDEDGDGFPEDTDCDDTDGMVNPGRTEICNGVDDNCDGAVDEGFDADGDGSLVPQFCPDGDDCNDDDATIYPGATEVPYDGIDQDCDGADLTDMDGDGYEGGTGEDCDDDDSEIHPGATDVPYDGIDQDCTGADLLDADGDGHDSDAHGGDDCDDTDASTHPGAPDWMNDGINNDCDGLADSYQSLTGDLSVSIVGTTSSQEALLGRGTALCDLDSDGLQDVVISAPFSSDYSGQTGIFYGSNWSTWGRDMTLAGANTLITGDRYEFSGFGTICTDIDNDGHDDLVIGTGEINYGSMGLDEAASLLVFYGTGFPLSATLNTTDADTRIDAPMDAQDGAFVYGIGLGHGDFDGDGTPEMVISTGGPRLDVHNGEERIHILVGSRFGGALRFYYEVDFTLEPDGDETEFGSWDARAGLDADGSDELILRKWDWQEEGDPDDDCDTAAPGVPDTNDPDCQDTSPPFSADDTAYEDAWSRGAMDFLLDPMVDLVGAVTPADARTARFQGDNTGEGFGFDSITGDFDGDGLNDLVVSAVLNEDNGLVDAGGLYAFSGINAELAGTVTDATTLADGALYGGYQFGYFGTSLANLGDANGDGVDDLFVTEAGGSGGVGMAWMLDGANLWSVPTPEQAALLAWYGEAQSDGLLVTQDAGDIDGDGLNDLLLLQSDYDGGNGRVFVVLSSDW